MGQGWNSTFRQHFGHARPGGGARESIFLAFPADAWHEFRSKAKISNLCEGKIEELSVKYDNYTTNFKNISENHQTLLPVIR